MDKDAYYFPHFCNARHDRKIKRLRKELGLEGYGMFFMLLETLREQLDYKYPMQDIDLLAEEFGTSEPKLRIVICNYQLFEVDDKEQFFSPRLFIYMQPYIEKSERARQMALKRWNKPLEIEDSCTGNAIDDAQAMLQHSVGNASKVNKSKVNKSKVKYADRVSLLSEEYEKLVGQYSKEIIDNKIIDLDLWKGSKGKNTKSDYLTLLAWLRKDKPIAVSETTTGWGNKKKW